MYSRVREFVFGPPLPTAQAADRGLNKVRALAAFFPDALSSIAFANQEIYLALLVAGAAATASTVLIVGAAKFLDGAWITLLLIPLMVTTFLRIRAHYVVVARELSLAGLPPSLRPIRSSRLVIPVAAVHRGVIHAVHVEMEEGSRRRCREEWRTWFPDIPLIVLPSPYRSMIEPVLRFLEETDTQENDGQLATLILPEFVPAHWWQAMLHNQTAWLLKAALLHHRRTLGLSRVGLTCRTACGSEARGRPVRAFIQRASCLKTVSRVTRAGLRSSPRRGRQRGHGFGGTTTVRPDVSSDSQSP
jgi:hypothetical protein